MEDEASYSPSGTQVEQSVGDKKTRAEDEIMEEAKLATRYVTTTFGHLSREDLELGRLPTTVPRNWQDSQDAEAKIIAKSGMAHSDSRGGSSARSSTTVIVTAGEDPTNTSDELTLTSETDTDGQSSQSPSTQAPGNNDDQSLGTASAAPPPLSLERGRNVPRQPTRPGAVSVSGHRSRVRPIQEDTDSGRNAVPAQETSHERPESANDNEDVLLSAELVVVADASNSSPEVLYATQASAADLFSLFTWKAVLERKSVRIGLVVFITLVAALVSGVLYGALNDSGSGPAVTLPENSSFPPSLAPVPFPSASPSISPTFSDERLAKFDSLLTLLRENLSAEEVDLILVDDTPQSLAARWLTGTSNYDTLPIFQRYALAVLFFSAGGDSEFSWWGANRWLSEESECDWESLNFASYYTDPWSFRACSEDGHMERLELNNIGLEGTLPKELRLLSSLQRLGLRYSMVTGEIAGVFQLTNLVTLDIFDHGNTVRESSNTIDGIPTEIGLMTNLEALNLLGLNITGTIPTEIGRLSLLQEFASVNNKMTGTFPTELGLATSLRILALSGNELEGTIPSELGRCTELEQLTVDNNPGMSGTIPAEIGNLTNLTIFDSRHTAIGGVFPDSLCDTANDAAMLFTFLVQCPDVQCRCCICQAFV